MMDIVMFESFKIFKMAVIVMDIQFSRRNLAQLVEGSPKGVQMIFWHAREVVWESFVILHYYEWHHFNFCF